MPDNKPGFHLDGRIKRRDLNQLLCDLNPCQNACQQVQSVGEKRDCQDWQSVCSTDTNLNLPVIVNRLQFWSDDFE
jgi:hypothetical protein